MMPQNENDITLVKDWINRAINARRAAHKVLSVHQDAVSRVVILEDVLKQLDKLPIDVKSYFEEAMDCLQMGLTRGSIVLAWSGFFHVFAQYLLSNHEAEFRQKRPKWKFNDLTELKESYPEFQIIETGRVLKVISNTEENIFKGQLSVRNKCAHPTLYRPTVNSALGYVDDILRQTIQFL